MDLKKVCFYGSWGDYLLKVSLNISNYENEWWVYKQNLNLGLVILLGIMPWKMLRKILFANINNDVNTTSVRIGRKKKNNKISIPSDISN